MRFQWNSYLLICTTILSLSTYSAVQSEETINVATLINKRTRQYPIKGYKAISVISPYRTGSTLVYNILKFLFESDQNKNKKCWEDCGCLVTKSHNFSEYGINYLYVFTIRNPIDACFSHYRVIREPNANKRELIEQIVESQMQCWRILYLLIAQNKPVVILKYEDFVDNIHYVFQIIQNKLSININEIDKAWLRKGLSKENVLSNITNLESFDEQDPLHQFHGKHIDKGEVPQDEKKLAMEIIIDKLKKYEAEFKKFGYSLKKVK